MERGTKKLKCQRSEAVWSWYGELNLSIEGESIKHNFCPRYLGVDLNRSLTFKTFLEKELLKIKTRNNIIQSRAGTNTLRTADFRLVWPTAEYCSPSWLNSVHSSKINVQLNNTMRIISGTLKCTPLQWMPVLCNIAPHHIKRQKALTNVVSKSIFFFSKSLLIISFVSFHQQQWAGSQEVYIYFGHLWCIASPIPKLFK